MAKKSRKRKREEVRGRSVEAHSNEFINQTHNTGHAHTNIRNMCTAILLHCYGFSSAYLWLLHEGEKKIIFVHCYCLLKDLKWPVGELRCRLQLVAMPAIIIKFDASRLFSFPFVGSSVLEIELVRILTIRAAAFA